MPVLEVELRGAILVIQIALLDRYMTGLHIEEHVERRLTRFSGLAGLRLVGRAVGVHNDVKLWLHYFQVAQENARAQETQHTEAHTHALGLGVGRLAGSFEAVDDKPAGLGLLTEQMPVEGGDFDAPAGGRLQYVHHLAEDKVLKSRRACRKIQSYRSYRQKNHQTGHRQGKVAQEEAAQTAGAGRRAWFIVSHPFR